jgi:hypothetical protein
MRLQRMGCYRLHWVTEWQRRGVPHLHLAAYFPTEVDADRVIAAWLAVAEPYRAGRRGQYVLPITDAVGWFQYVSKHAARGVKHYQRSKENMPEAWRGKTGRVWGKTGDWPTVDPDEMIITDAVYYRLRRVMRGLRLADARAEVQARLKAQASGFLPFVAEADRRRVLRVLARPASRRVTLARRMLRGRDRRLADVRGVSEWLRRGAVLQALYWAQACEVPHESG